MTLLVESCGSRTPSLLRLPPGEPDFALADTVLDWVDAIGMTLFGWQRDVLRLALARRGAKWAAYEVDLVLPRQNGKNEVLIALELAALNVLGNRLVVHSAHEAMTAQKHFNRFRDLADLLPEVEKLLPRTKTRGFYTANGKEHIRFANGAVLDFKTRTKNAGRGFSADLVVLDEAFNLPPQAYGSLMYTLRARKNPQVWKTSSAAHATSLVLHNDRERAKQSDPDDSRLLYIEWGNEADCDPADPDTWLRSNPSVGHTAPGFGLELQTFRNEYASAKQTPELLAEFVREVCGVPEAPMAANASPIALDRWNDLIDADATPTSESIRLALDAPPDRTSAAFCVAGKLDNGLLYVEVRDNISPNRMRDLVARSKELSDGHGTPLILPPGSPALSWKPDLEAAGVKVDVLTPAEFAAAFGYLQAQVNEGTLRHRGQPELAKAIGGLGVKLSGDVEVPTRRSSSSNVAPFMAACAALARVPTGKAKKIQAAFAVT